MKTKPKYYKDLRQYVRPHRLKLDDLALRAQKQTKTNPPYNPKPYKIIETKKQSPEMVKSGRN